MNIKEEMSRMIGLYNQVQKIEAEADTIKNALIHDTNIIKRMLEFIDRFISKERELQKEFDISRYGCLDKYHKWCLSYCPKFVFINENDFTLIVSDYDEQVEYTMTIVLPFDENQDDEYVQKEIERLTVYYNTEFEKQKKTKKENLIKKFEDCKKQLEEFEKEITKGETI